MSRPWKEVAWIEEEGEVAQDVHAKPATSRQGGVRSATNNSVGFMGFIFTLVTTP